jgi:hypothetical protein
MALVMLPVSAAQAATVIYWDGNHASSTWKYSILTTIRGGSMYIFGTDYADLKQEVRTASGTVTYQATATTAYELTWTMQNAQTSRRVWCTW